jgi:hypothetical protein
VKVSDAMESDSTGYDERLFRLMLAEYVRRHFSEEARRKMPDVRIGICTPFDLSDPESDPYDTQNIIVISFTRAPRPHGPGKLHEGQAGRKTGGAK